MRVLMRGAAAIILAAAIGGAQAPRSENVVLVTLDGARWQEVFGGMDEALLRASAPRGTDITTTQTYKDYGGSSPVERRERLMPFLWRTLIVNHGWIAGNRALGSAVAVTNRHWFSYPGYSEILTGQSHDDVIKSNDAIRNPYPTVLEFARRKLQLRPSDVATFASWGVFRAIVEHDEGATTVNAGVDAYASPAADLQMANALQRQTLTPWSNVRHDAYTFRFALDYLQRAHPRLLYIAFDETDDWAHDNKYDHVLDTLHREDAYLSELWTALQGDDRYRNRTTLIVTVDHGRGRTAADWQKHGKDVPGANEIWLAIASPGTTLRGERRDHPTLFQSQIAATIAAALGLDYREQNAAAGTALALR